MRCFVRVDGGVLDDGLGADVGSDGCGSGDPGAGARGAVEKDIQIPGAGWFQTAKCIHGARSSDRLGDLDRNGQRRFPQRARELECDRHREIAKSAIGRVLGRDGWHGRWVESVASREGGGDAFTKQGLKGQYHEARSGVSWASSMRARARRWSRAVLTFRNRVPSGSNGVSSGTSMWVT